MGVFGFVQGPREEDRSGVKHGETAVQFAIGCVVLQRLLVVSAFARTILGHAIREDTIHFGTT